MSGNLTDGMDVAKIKEVAQQLTTQSGKIGEVATSGTSQAATLAENWTHPSSCAQVSRR